MQERVKVGTDIVKIERIKSSLERFGDKFLNNFLLPSELALAKNPASTAGLWAAKEAASKALGCGICAECGFSDIIVSKDSKGAPLLSFSQSVMKNFKVKDTSLSISHDGDFALAMVALVLG